MAEGLVAPGAPSLDVGAGAPDPRLIDGHGRRWGSEECSLPAPLALLERLVKNITEKQVIASDLTVEKHPDHLTPIKREVLARPDERRASRRGFWGYPMG